MKIFLSLVDLFAKDLEREKKSVTIL